MSTETPNEYQFLLDATFSPSSNLTFLLMGKDVNDLIYPLVKQGYFVKVKDQTNYLRRTRRSLGYIQPVKSCVYGCTQKGKEFLENLRVMNAI